MVNCELKPSFKDADYRKMAESIIDYAQKKIEIVGSNLSCINYPEVLYSLRVTGLEGANIFIYFNEVSSHILEYLKDSDVNLYQMTKRFTDEYIIIDRKSMISSKIQDGYRIGVVTEHGPRFKEIITNLDELRNDQSTKIIKEIKIRPRREKIIIQKPTQKEISAYKELFERITVEVSKDVIPEKLTNLEESIRASRERFL